MIFSGYIYLKKAEYYVTYYFLRTKIYCAVRLTNLAVPPEEHAKI